MIIAEVKAGWRHLNGPWTNPDRQNVQCVLNAIGIFPPEGVVAAAEALFDLTGGQVRATG